MVDFNEPGSSRERAPVVKRDAAPASRPTPAPLRRAHGEAAMLRMRAETFDEAMEERAAAGDVIVGPFEARDAAEAEQLKRALLSDKEAVRKLQQRQADLESPLRPRARALAKEAMQAVEALERRGQTAELQRRQSQDEQRCFVGNDKLSCYPTNGLQVVQGQWSKFIWNTNYPEFTNNGGFVDVYLFHQDSDLIATSWTSLPNAQGRLSFSPNDPYWERRTAAANFTGQNITWPFYFVVTSSGFGLGGETTRLSTWTAVQTALPRAIAASRSEAAASASAAALSSSLALASASATATLTGAAASAASSSAAAASSSVAASFTSALISSLTAAGLTGTETTRGVLTTTLSNGQIVTASATVRANGIPIAPQSDDSGLPKYAIALIAVFGFLALVAAIVGLYFLMAAARRRRRQQASHAGSDSPMMRGIDGTASVAGTDVYSDAGAAAALRRSTAGEESSPFSTDEATRMADAFRAALRKPAFDETVILAGSPDGDSPGEQDTGRALLREELKSEGREVQNVGERKTPTIGGQ